MRIVLTIIACLLLAQYAVGLHLHAEAEASANVTASGNSSVDALNGAEGEISAGAGKNKTEEE